MKFEPYYAESTQQRLRAQLVVADLSFFQLVANCDGETGHDQGVAAAEDAGEGGREEGGPALHQAGRAQCHEGRLQGHPQDERR